MTTQDQRGWPHFVFSRTERLESSKREKATAAENTTDFGFRCKYPASVSGFGEQWSSKRA
jgi:hypothetical protein